MQNISYDSTLLKLFAPTKQTNSIWLGPKTN